MHEISEPQGATCFLKSTTSAIYKWQLQACAVALKSFVQQTIVSVT